MFSYLKNIINRFFSQNKIVVNVKSKYNTLEVVKQHNHTLLNSRNTNYSFGNLHKVFRFAFKKIPFQVNEIKNVLILGFGAGSVAHILQNELHCNCKITGVEIDEKVIFLAKKYFRLNSLKNTKIIIDDAFNYVKTTKEKFDIVVVDIFIDHKIPQTFNSSEFLEKISILLSQNGRVYFNRLCYDFSSKQENKNFEKVFQKTFSNTKIIKIDTFSKNIIFIGNPKL